MVLQQQFWVNSVPLYRFQDDAENPDNQLYWSGGCDQHCNISIFVLSLIFEELSAGEKAGYAGAAIGGLIVGGAGVFLFMKSRISREGTVII